MQKIPSVLLDTLLLMIHELSTPDNVKKIDELYTYIEYLRDIDFDE